MTLTLFIKLFSSGNALHQRDAVRLPGYHEKRELRSDNADLFLEYPGSIHAPYKGPPGDPTARTTQSPPEPWTVSKGASPGESSELLLKTVSNRQ